MINIPALIFGKNEADFCAGYMEAFKQLSEEKLTALAKVVPPNLIGVEQSEEMLEWIWDNFSAVAGDHPAFEAWRKDCPSIWDRP